MSRVKKLTLDEALGSIQQICEDRVRPFFFIVGAGISNPPVKLAWQMIADFRKEARKRGRTTESRGILPIDEYSHWFEQAYRSNIERQDYLSRQIIGKYISHANFRLAHILLDRRIANLVITPNFDDFLSRALHLFGKQHLVYDRPETFGLIDAEREDIQLVHVHGSYRFYDSCNLKVEIAEQAEGFGGQYSKTVSIIENILSRRTPLVIDYSGWEGDAIMTALRSSLVRRLPNNLYWFCYKESNIDSLPDWIRNHPNVYFVIPKADLRGMYDSRKAPPTRIGSEETLTKDVESSKTFRQKRPDPALPARDVFDQFIRMFNMEIPALARNPLKFFIDQLSGSLPREGSKNQGGDIYSIRSVINRIQRAKDIEEEEITQSVISKLEKVRNALRTSDYEEVIKAAGTIDPRQLSNEQRNEMVAALWSALEETYDESDQEQTVYNLIISIGANLPPAYTDHTTKVALAKAQVGLGLKLGEQEEYEAAIAAFDRIITQVRKTDKKELNEALALALVNKAVMLNRQGRYKDALAVYQKVINRFSKTRDVALQRGLIRALFNKTVTLSASGKSRETIPIYTEIIKRFGNTSDSDIKGVLASALINKGYIHGILNQPIQEIESYNEVIIRFSSSLELSLQRSVAKALGNKAIALLRAKKYSDAISTSNDLIRRFKGENKLSLQQFVTKAYLVKGDALSESGHKESAIRIYNKVVVRYAPINDPVLQHSVAFALVKKGNQYINVQQAATAYDEVIHGFSGSHDPQIQEQVAIALFNKGNKLFEAEDFKDAINTYREVEKRYGRIPLMQSYVSRASVNEAGVLTRIKRYKAAIKLYDSLIERFSDTEDTSIQGNVAAAIFSKGVALTKRGDRKKANRVYDEMIHLFADKIDEGIRHYVASAMLQKCYNLNHFEQTDNALEVIDELLYQFKKSKQIKVKILLAAALELKGYILGKSNKHDESIKAYNKVLRQFGDASGPELDEVIAIAKNGVGFQLICKAKRDLSKSKRSAAIAKLNKAQEIINGALQRNPMSSKVGGYTWANLGYITFLLGDKSRARQLFKKAFQIGGDEVFKGTLKDATIYPLEEDKEFIKLIRSAKSSL